MRWVKDVTSSAAMILIPRDSMSDSRRHQDLMVSLAIVVREPIMV